MGQKIYAGLVPIASRKKPSVTPELMDESMYLATFWQHLLNFLVASADLEQVNSMPFALI